MDDTLAAQGLKDSVAAIEVISVWIADDAILPDHDRPAGSWSAIVRTRTEVPAVWRPPHGTLLTRRSRRTLLARVAGRTRLAAIAGFLRRTVSPSLARLACRARGVSVAVVASGSTFGAIGGWARGSLGPLAVRWLARRVR